VWVARWDAFTSSQRELHALLVPAEREHVDRHRSERDRARVRLSRSLLRLLVAAYLGADPTAIDFDRRCAVCGRPHGKPRLRGGHGLDCSVSHGDGLTVFAFVGASSVGVDVESLAAGPGPPPPELVAMALTSRERRHLDAVPIPSRWKLFLSYWPRKEAVLKQRGLGLSSPMNEIAIGPPAPGTGRDLPDAGRAGERTWVRRLDVGPSHVGALATGREVTELRIADAPATLLSPRCRR
jgi:4'-phosphopantetheinyl transferase